jgi:HK97 family phage major capsid protein
MTYPSVPTRVSSLPDGTALSRYLMVLGESRGDSHRALLLAEQWPTTPTVKATFDLAIKGAVAPGTTSDATFAGPLAVHGIGGEALQLLRGSSILGALESKFRRVPFRTTVARETGSGTGGSWVGEGLSTPVAATAFDALSQEAYKASVIVVLSNELLRLGDPAAERSVRESVIAGVGAFLDAQLLTNTVTLVANTRPAAITNGATAVTSTGTTAAQMNADLAALLAALTTPGPLAWIMQPKTAYRIAATIGGTAAVNVPHTLFGIPLVLSANSPAQVTLLDPSQILYSDNGGIEIDSTEQAALQMDGVLTDPAVAATVFTSLWQNNLWGVRVTRWISYLRAQTGSVAYMTVSY